MGLYSEEGSIRPTPPFDFAKSLDFLGKFPPMRDDQTVSELSVTKAVRVGGRAIVFQLKPTGTIKMPGLKYTLFADHPFSRGLTEVVIDRISFFLSLSDELEQFYRIAINDSNFAPVLQKLYGLHQVKFLTPFECACWAVLSQRNQLSAARKAKGALLDHFGTSLEVGGRVYRAFPEPGQMREASEDEVKALLRHERREEYLGHVITAFNEVDEKFLRTADYDKVEEWLKNIRGIGEWSARLILLRGLGRMEKLGSGETTDRGSRQSLRETDDGSEDSRHRRKIRTMERLLGVLSENSSRTLKTQRERANVRDSFRILAEIAGRVWD